MLQLLLTTSKETIFTSLVYFGEDVHSTDIRLEWPKYELHKNCILDVLAFPHKYTNINCYNDFASIKCI